MMMGLGRLPVEGDASGLNAVGVRSLAAWAVVLLPAPLIDQPHDIARGAARDQARDVVEVDPSTPGDLAARPRFGLPRYFAGKDVVVLLLAANVEQVPGRLAEEAGLLLELSKRGLRKLLTALQHAARQCPLRLTACYQENSLASTTDHGGPFLQLELPLRSRRALLDASA